MEVTRHTLDLDREQWEQVKAAIAPALLLPEPERVAAVERVLAHDPDLRAYAVDILQYYDTATRRFDLATGDSTGTAPPASHRATAPVAIGAVVGSYRVLRRLGAGGMGVVYLAEDQRLGRQVALKFLSPGLSASRADSRARLLNESRSAAVLNHPGIVTLLDVIESGDELITVMEYVEGRPLDDLIEAGPMSLGYALRLMFQLTEALAYAHSRGIAHCDLKPANIHVLPNGAPKILDFGLARALAGAGGGDGPRTGPLFGTPGYLAPEQLLGREPTASADVYALGVIFYQVLTGTAPFPFGDNTRLLLDTVTREPVAPSAHVPGIPASIDALALRCLHKDPRQRLQPHEVNRALGTAIDELEPLRAAADRRLPDVSGIEALTPRTVAARLRSWTTRASAIVTLAAVSGFVTSWTFNAVVERPLAFDPDPVARQLITGFQSLVFPALTGSLMLGIVSVLHLSATFALTRMRGGATLARLDGLFRTHREIVFPALAQSVVFVGLVSLALVFAIFGDVLDALTSRLGSADRVVLQALHPSNRWHQLMYRVSAPALLAVLIVAWRGISVSASHYGGKLPGGVRAAAFSLMGLLVILVQAPYKLTVQPELPVVMADEQRCYLLGERNDDARVYCPGGQEPRVRTISRLASHISGCGFDENIFLGTGGRTCQ